MTTANPPRTDTDRTLVRRAHRARTGARKLVPVTGVLAAVTGTVALAGGAVAVEASTRWGAGFACAAAVVSFVCFCRAAAAQLPDFDSEENK